MRRALLLGAVWLCATAPGAAFAQNGTGQRAVTVDDLLKVLDSQAVSLVGDAVFSLILGPGTTSAGAQVVQSVVSNLAVDYARDLKAGAACPAPEVAEQQSLVGKTAAYLQTVWPRPETVKNLLPDVRVTVVEPAEDRVSIRIVPSRDGSLLRIVRTE